MSKPEHERRTSLAGVFIGDKNDKLKIFLEELAKRGAPIYETTLSRIRGGDISGSVVTQQLLLGEVLKTGNPQLKCKLFSDIADTAEEMRYHQSGNSPRYLSEGFTKAVAADLDFSDGNVRNCLRAMRADLLLYCIGKSATPDLIVHFVQIAESYLRAYSSPPSDKGAKHKIDIDNHWNRTSVVDFYRRIYGIRGPRTIGTWVPYEVEIFSQFYKLQSDVGWLTPLDKLILDAYRVRGQNDGLVTFVKEKTLIDYNQDALTAHANALAFGSPVNPLISESIGSSKA